jgi:hypothetical protein
VFLPGGRGTCCDFVGFIFFVRVSTKDLVMSRSSSNKNGPLQFEEMVQVDCTRCFKVTTSTRMWDDALHMFFLLGWRAVGVDCLCPKCARELKVL